ncbi:hypothetical protein [Sphingomonas sp. Leaf25]|uniref:hypothetical protein n=1 Tax=Sphingomonas sp. Leaf25 TaxID=1735692 RepID=UPI0006FC8FBD|nr:hypothetical protein [Sphingomonas sp. Leaf25]KQN05182.1 hypothetical protein ASE78_16800 [Sphingomonas sp. Leaf25]
MNDTAMLIAELAAFQAQHAGRAAQEATIRRYRAEGESAMAAAATVLAELIAPLTTTLSDAVERQQAAVADAQDVLAGLEQRIERVGTNHRDAITAVETLHDRTVELHQAANRARAPLGTSVATIETAIGDAGQALDAAADALTTTCHDAAERHAAAIATATEVIAAFVEAIERVRHDVEAQIDEAVSPAIDAALITARGSMTMAADLANQAVYYQLHAALTGVEREVGQAIDDAVQEVLATIAAFAAEAAGGGSDAGMPAGALIREADEIGRLLFDLLEAAAQVPQRVAERLASIMTGGLF